MTPTTLTRWRPLKRSRKRLKIRVRKRDLEWAKAVKERDHQVCRRCYFTKGPEGHYEFYKRRGLHACHIFGRSRKSTRWDQDNGLTLCMGCHLYFHAHPLEFIEFAKRELGEERFEALRERAMQTTKKVAG